METQFEANADAKIGSAAVEHLHSNKSDSSFTFKSCEINRLQKSGETCLVMLNKMYTFIHLLIVNKG